MSHHQHKQLSIGSMRVVAFAYFVWFSEEGGSVCTKLDNTEMFTEMNIINSSTSTVTNLTNSNVFDT